MNTKRGGSSAAPSFGVKLHIFLQGTFCLADMIGGPQLNASESSIGKIGDFLEVNV